jgi:hypothetical protein
MPLAMTRPAGPRGYGRDKKFMCAQYSQDAPVSDFLRKVGLVQVKEVTEAAQHVADADVGRMVYFGHALLMLECLSEQYGLTSPRKGSTSPFLSPAMFVNKVSHSGRQPVHGVFGVTRLLLGEQKAARETKTGTCSQDTVLRRTIRGRRVLQHLVAVGPCS